MSSKKQTRLTVTVDGDFPHTSMTAAFEKMKQLIDLGASSGSFNAQLSKIEDGDQRTELTRVTFAIESIGPTYRRSEPPDAFNDPRS